MVQNLFELKHRSLCLSFLITTISKTLSSEKFFLFFFQKENVSTLFVFFSNLATIAKRSEQTLIGTKKIVERKSLRRASSLHLNENDLNSRTSTFNNENHPRRSLCHIEKFSGIKCSLPKNKTTIPKTCKTFEKYSTPTKTSFSSSEVFLIFERVETEDETNFLLDFVSERIDDANDEPRTSEKSVAIEIWKVSQSSTTDATLSWRIKQWKSFDEILWVDDFIHPTLFIFLDRNSS